MTPTGRAKMSEPEIQNLKSTKRATIAVDLAKGKDKSAFAVLSRKATRTVLITGDVLVIDRDWINGFRAGRKADRAALALVVETIATAHGATVERRDEAPNPGYRGASVHFNLKVAGVGVMLSIDNLHGGDYSLLHWHNSYENGNRQTGYFSPAFNAAVGSTGNVRPHHKATSCPRDWYALAFALNDGLSLAARGEAYLAEATS